MQLTTNCTYITSILSDSYLMDSVLKYKEFSAHPAVIDLYFRVRIFLTLTDFIQVDVLKLNFVNGETRGS